MHFPNGQSERTGQVAGGKSCPPHFPAWECHGFGLFAIRPVESNQFYFLSGNFYIFALKANGSVTGIGPQEGGETEPAGTLPSPSCPPLPSPLPSLSPPLHSPPLPSSLTASSSGHCTGLHGCGLSLGNSQPGVGE